MADPEEDLGGEGLEDVIPDPNQVEGIDASWKEAVFGNELLKDYLLPTIVGQHLGETFYPPPDQVWRAFSDVPLDKVRVVILGQDPYHNGTAIGRAFAQPGTSPIHSLRNIGAAVEANGYAVATNRRGKYCFDASLQSWVDQGVLLLNTTLTVAPGQPLSHKDLWQGVVRSIINLMTTARPGIVFLLWGGKARDFRNAIVGLGSRQSGGHVNHVIECIHPSPMNGTKFHDVTCFQEASEWLEANTDGGPIDWSLSDVGG